MDVKGKEPPWRQKIYQIPINDNDLAMIDQRKRREINQAKAKTLKGNSTQKSQSHFLIMPTVRINVGQ